jgi:hypothetical protein
VDSKQKEGIAMKTVCSQTGWRLWLPLVEAVQQVKREKNMVNSV